MLYSILMGSLLWVAIVVAVDALERGPARPSDYTDSGDYNDE